LRSCSERSPAATTRGLRLQGVVFGMSASEIESTFDVAVAVGTGVNEGLDANDGELFLSQFQPGARVIDPIVPSLTPSVADFFFAFQSLCTRWLTDEVLVNLDGSLSVGDCAGFYDAISGDDAATSSALPDGLPAVRHLPISDGLASELMHRLDADTVGQYPVETVTIIGFPESRAQDVTSQVGAAEEFIARFEAAWASEQPESVAALYSGDAVRHDGYVGDLAGQAELIGWVSSVLDQYPDVAATTESLYSSGRGPAAVYQLTMTVNGDACSMRVGSVWDLDAQGLIEQEFVYYDIDSIFDCGWAA
jgi:SnoaL-like domain